MRKNERENGRRVSIIMYIDKNIRIERIRKRNIVSLEMKLNPSKLRSSIKLPCNRKIYIYIYVKNQNPDTHNNQPCVRTLTPFEMEDNPSGNLT